MSVRMNVSIQDLARTRVSYGVDLQGNEPVIVRAERTRGKISCTEYGEVPPADPRAMVAGCLSTSESLTRWIEAPYASLGKARKVFPTLLDIRLPFALEDCAYQFVGPVRTGEGKTEVLAVVARLSDVRRKMEQYAALGMDPPILDQEGLALWSQSCREAPDPAGEMDVPRLVVYLGVDRTVLAVGRGRRFLNAHTLPSPDPREIGRLLRAWLGPDGGEVHWMWAGPAAGDKTRIGTIQTSLRQTWPGRSTVHTAPREFLARALASRAILPASLGCNLRSGELMHPVVRNRLMVRSVQPSVPVFLSGLLLLVAGLGTRIQARAREVRLDRQTAALVDRLAGYHVAARGEHALGVVTAELEKRFQRLQPFAQAFQPSLSGIVRSVVDTGRVSGLRYEELSLSRDEVRISGTAPGWESCEALMSGLREAGFAVRLERRGELAEERVGFSIRSGSTDE
jgi:hypothetical protein